MINCNNCTQYIVVWLLAKVGVTKMESMVKGKHGESQPNEASSLTLPFQNLLPLPLPQPTASSLTPLQPPTHPPPPAFLYPPPPPAMPAVK